MCDLTRLFLNTSFQNKIKAVLHNSTALCLAPIHLNMTQPFFCGSVFYDVIILYPVIICFVLR